jgi:hypothetical protein
VKGVFGMKFPGYWVLKTSDGVAIQKYEFDETELSPESKWKEAYENAEGSKKQWGGLSLDDALVEVGKMLHAPNDEVEPKTDKKAKANKTAEFRKLLFKVYGETVLLEGSVRNPNKATRFECHNGHFWMAVPSEVLNGKNCPKCGTRKYSHIAKLRARRGTAVKLVGEYKNADTATAYKCGTCGHKWDLMPKNIYDERSKCPKCSG